jgi:hypothetical protein
MDKLASIRNKAFINELQKIAIKTCHKKDLYNFIKKASFIDEKHILNSCGSGKTYGFIKFAEEYNITPGYWEGKKGLHKAISEDPKKYETKRGLALGTMLGSSVIGASVGTAVKTMQFSKEKRFIGKNYKLRKQINKAGIVPSIVAGLFAGELAKHKLENAYLNQYGIKKNLLDPRYHYTHEAYNKYYK